MTSLGAGGSNGLAPDEPTGPSGLLDIAVVGMHARVPGARDLEELWDVVRRGADTVTRFGRRREVDQEYTEAAGVIDGFDRFDHALFGISHHDAEIMDPQHRLLMEGVLVALEHAGLAGSDLLESTGLFVSVSSNSYLVDVVLPALGADGAKRVDLTTLIANEKDFAATRIAYRLDLQGPCMAVQTACSSSLVAVHEACRSLLAGDCDVAVVAAASIRVPHLAGPRWIEGSIFSKSGVCSPFDASADGCVLGNGACAVVLRRLEDALDDGDSVHGVILGSAVNNDGGRKVGYAAPSVGGQADVVLAALRAADVAPEQVGYIECHGTATKLGDAVECSALKRAFGGSGATCFLGSIKANVGHLDVAAGLLGLVKTCLALHARVIPPMAHFETVNPELGLGGTPFCVSKEGRVWSDERGRRIAGVSSFGIGGTNAHVVVSEAPSDPSPGLPQSGEQSCVQLSARTALELDEAAKRLADHLEKNPSMDVRDVARTMREGRRVHAERGIVVASDIDELITELRRPGGVVRQASELPASIEELLASQAREFLHSGRSRSARPRGETFARRVPLPGTILRGVPCWIRPDESRIASETGGAPVLHEVAWSRSRVAPCSRPRGSNRWLVLRTGGRFAAALVDALRARDEPVECFERPPDGTTSAEEVERVVSGFFEGAKGREFTIRVIHAWLLDEAPCEGGTGTDREFQDARVFGLDVLLAIGRAAMRLGSDDRVRLDVLTDHRFAILPDDRVVVSKAMVSGPVRVLPQEIPTLECSSIDVALTDDFAPVLETVLACLDGDPRPATAVRGATLWRRAVFESGPITAPDVRVRGRWLVTGAFGGIGAHLARELARRGADELVLVHSGRDRPDTGALADSITSAGGSLPPVSLIHDDPELVRALDQLCSWRVVSYWSGIGVEIRPGAVERTSALADRMRLVPSLRRLFECMVRIVVEDGWADRDEDRLRWRRSAPTSEEIDTVRARVLERDASLEAMIGFFERCVAAYPSAISGDVASIAVLYPDGDGDLLRETADTMLTRSTGDACVSTLAKWISGVVASSRPGKVRILEFGAGNGLLTERVARETAKHGDSVEYHVTDIGRSLVRRLADRAQEWGLDAANFATLDIAGDPDDQGFEAGSFDLVFGLNVVHATPDVSKTLRQVRKLLRPNGTIAIIESVREERWVDLVAGLAPDWWSFCDDRRRNSPLMPPGDWIDAISESGYSDVAVWPSEEVDRERADCVLFAARRAGCPEEPAAPTRSLVEDVRAAGARPLVVTADLTDAREVEDALAEVRGEPVVGVVHCAGRVAGALVRNLDATRIDVELGARVNGLRHVLAALDRLPETLVLSSSLNVLFGGEGQAAYVAANSVLDSIAEAGIGATRRVVTIDWDRWHDVGLARDFQATYRSLTGRDLEDGLRPEDGVAAFLQALESDAPVVAPSVHPFRSKYDRYLRRPVQTKEISPAVEPTSSEDEGAQPKSQPEAQETRRGVGFEALVLDAVSRCLGAGAVSIDQRLDDVGTDSLEILQIQRVLEDLTGLRVHSVPLLTQPLRHVVQAAHEPDRYTASVSVVDAARLERALEGAS